MTQEHSLFLIVTADSSDERRIGGDSECRESQLEALKPSSILPSSFLLQRNPIPSSALQSVSERPPSLHSSYLVELSLPGVILLRRLLLHAMVPADGDRCSGLVLRLRLLVVVVSLLVRLMMLDLVRMELLMMVERLLLLLLLLRLLMHLHLLVMRERVQALL